MAKKTWIKLKRGLLEPKHRDALGIRIWLYLYILDNTDWETGKMLEWRDSDAADSLRMPQRTIRDQRVKLEEDGYIQCQQGLHKQIITVMNWTDPRLHSETTINNGDNNLTPLENEVHGDIHGDTHGDIHGYMQLDTLTSNKHITYHISLQEKFTSITGIEMKNGSRAVGERWFKEIHWWVQKEVTEDIISKAVALAAGKYTVTGPWSLKTIIANLLMEREQSHAALEGYTAG